MSDPTPPAAMTPTPILTAEEIELFEAQAKNDANRFLASSVRRLLATLDEQSRRIADLERFTAGWQKAVYTILTVAGLSPARYSADEAAQAMQTLLAEKDRRIADLERALLEMTVERDLGCEYIERLGDEVAAEKARADAAVERERVLRTLLADLLAHVDRNTCEHEETHRGGAIWTICDGCGQKWADDRGGFEPHKDAPPVAAARAALSSPAQGNGEADQSARRGSPQFRSDEMNEAVEREMPRYQSHKKVWALKIASIVYDGEGEERESDGSATITPTEAGYAPFKVDHAYVSKHKPQVGGYYVVYDDGYKSWSPAAAFEEGYTRL